LGLLLAALALAGAVRAQDEPLPAAVEQAARSTITRAVLEAPIRFLSSDLLEGRGPATRGDQLARLYLQTRLEGMGYQPAFANGSWQQSFDTDRLDGRWNFDGMIEDAQLVMLSTWFIAQADALPTWKPADEFEAARKQALAAVGGR